MDSNALWIAEDRIYQEMQVRRKKVVRGLLETEVYRLLFAMPPSGPVAVNPTGAA